MKRIGLERNGLERSGPEWPGEDSIGEERTGGERNGLAWVLSVFSFYLIRTWPGKDRSGAD